MKENKKLLERKTEKQFLAFNLKSGFCECLLVAEFGIWWQIFFDVINGNLLLYMIATEIEDIYIYQDNFCFQNVFMCIFWFFSHFSLLMLVWVWHFSNAHAKSCWKNAVFDVNSGYAEIS